MPSSLSCSIPFGVAGFVVIGFVVGLVAIVELGIGALGIETLIGALVLVTGRIGIHMAKHSGH
jgi:hypothetical protein